MKLLNSQPLVVDKGLAVILGLNEALVLQQIHYWLEINKKNKRNFHEGRYWTYNTLKDWQKEFPFWSLSTIKRILKKLREKKLIEVDNFNIYQMDRTLWYTINYEEVDKLYADEEGRVWEEKNMDGGAQNSQAISSKEASPKVQAEPMERLKKASAIPENTTKISTEISISSINQSQKMEDGQRKNNLSLKFKEKYERIIDKCELYALDEKYRQAVAHAIRLLVLDVERKGYIKLADSHIPASVVERDMERLNFFVVEHAVNRFKEASRIQRISNPLGYLKVLIYNAIHELEIYMDARLRYERLIS
ncbi:MAG: hypothetical protein GXZ06_02315 [Tissierellia bacterium]|nr:hypothetical protein [Tissierellia bacterium]